eukprot:2101024-Prymnesium_polylepis.2
MDLFREWDADGDGEVSERERRRPRESPRGWFLRRVCCATSCAAVSAAICAFYATVLRHRLAPRSRLLESDSGGVRALRLGRCPRTSSERRCRCWGSTTR